MDNEVKKSYVLPLITLTTLFFMWGFITCLNDILIPYFKDVFQLEQYQATLVQLAFFLAYFFVSAIYFFVSATWGDPILKVGYKNTIALGLFISAVACFLFFIEASAEEPVFWVFLTALFLLGAGFTFLQIAANPLVASLGSSDTASSRLNLSQAFNSLGTTLAPVIGGTLIFQYFLSEGGGVSSVRIPYLVLASLLLILFGVIFFADIPAVNMKDDNRELDKLGALKYPHLVFGMIGIFCYVGAEVAIGSNLVDYMNKFHGLDNLEASRLLTFYWGGAMIGRFMGSISMSKMDLSKKIPLMVLSAVASLTLIFFTLGKAAHLNFNGVVDFFITEKVYYFLAFMTLNFFVFLLAKSVPSRTLGLFSFVNILLIVLMLSTTGNLSLWAILAVGLFNSIMFPNVITLAIDGLGKYTSQGSSLLVMMILGGALVPFFQGLVADMVNAQIAFALPLACYAYLLWYGFVGSKNKKNKTTDLTINN
ncbi:MAG: sugar MFS transporter [Paludibacteraceae bacterium]|nr:sugar MFS transporter [Paludibacteraceae bacterium]